jgi:hypothetical protein
MRACYAMKEAAILLHVSEVFWNFPSNVERQGMVCLCGLIAFFPWRDRVTVFRITAVCLVTDTENSHGTAGD